MRWFGNAVRHRRAGISGIGGAAGVVNVAAGDVPSRFRAAWAGLDDPDTASFEFLPVRLARACLHVLPVAGAGLSLLTDDFRVPLGATDDIAGFAERLQFTQGEGPCLEAARTGRTVSVSGPDIERRWPTFAAELFEHTPYRALLSAPLPLAEENLGALDLYLHTAADLAAVEVADVAIVASLIAATLLHPAFGLASAGSGSTEPAWLRSSPASERTDVWVAMGIVMARRDVGAIEALALLRAHAYSRGTVLDELASLLITGDVDPDQLGG